MLRSKKCSAIMRCKIVLVSVLLQVTFSFEISDDDSHQGIVQLARIERPGYWTFIEDKSQSNGGVLPYSRLGRKVIKLPQTLIPYPRAGRMLVDSEVLDYDESLLPEYTLHNLADSTLADIFFDGKSLGTKRGSIAFPPRIGRKKRSISEGSQLGNSDRDNAKNQDDSLESFTGQDWSELNEFERPDFFFRDDRRPSSRSRNGFVPRVGKKRSEESLEEMMENKRALAFQPRVGRDPIITRINRNDQSRLFQVKSRGAFVPRIGRRSGFIPRVGRSVKHNLENKE